MENYEERLRNHEERLRNHEERFQRNHEYNLKLLKQAVDYVWSKKLKHVFTKKGVLEKVVIVMFDKKHLFVLTTDATKRLFTNTPQKEGFYNLYILTHKIKFRKHDFIGWRSGLENKILKYLPEEFSITSQLELPRISGPVPSIFLALHKDLKKKVRKLDPYTTEESFLATIIHEFGHAYYDSVKKPWHGEKTNNLVLLDTALKLFSNQSVPVVDITLPPPAIFSEVFAFCCEYYSASKLWPNHKKAIDQEIRYFIKELIKHEKKLDLNYEVSVLDSLSFSHEAAAVMGRIIIEKYGSSWPKFFS